MTNSSPFEANIPRFFIYAALRGLGFGLVVATWVIFLQRQHGVSLTGATLIDVVFWIAATLGEVPTGVVADTYGRKTSLAVGVSIMGASLFLWAFAPTLALVMISYACLAIGVTFLSGADDAFFYESVQIVGRGDDYTRLVGRIGAVSLAFSALGNLASGLLATLDLRLPFIAGALCCLGQLVVILAFKEPRHDTGEVQARKSYVGVLKQAITLVRANPTLRTLMFYLVLAPMAAIITETVFVQPHAIALGVPVAGVGVIVMIVHLFNIAGSTWAHRLKARFGESGVLWAAPVFIVVSLILLAAFQVVPALLLIAVIGFVTAVLRPLALSRIQAAVPDDIRATILSLQSLTFTLVIAFVEPLLGHIADTSGLPASYVVLACGLAITMLVLFWRSRRHLEQVPLVA